MRKLIIILAGFFLAAALLTGCSSNKAVDSERATVNNTQDSLIANQPAEAMTYSPTRETKNGWIRTWGKDPNKVSYVYLQNSEGKMLGYYVLKGLPVSYCTSLVPTFDVNSSSEGKVVTPRPSMDGTYSTGTGGCNTYYGFDATSGAYIEYTAGLGINVLLFDQPKPNFNAPPLSDTVAK